MSVDAWLAPFESISLREMDSVALLNRTDTKYVFSSTTLEALLDRLSPHYRVLEIDGRRQARYRTVYFDSPALDFYHAHQNGKLNRIKVRCRQYVDSELFFLEKKLKNNRKRTVKSRIRIPGFIDHLEAEHRARLEIDHGLNLAPTLWNSFSRLTLVNHEHKERLTLDVALTFNLDGRTHDQSGLVICEAKQDGVNHGSPAIRALKEMHVRPMRMSKYCLGMALLSPGLKQNNFKKKILTINRLQHALAS